MRRPARSLRIAALVVGIITPCAAPSLATAQGCEPIRFTTPVNLGGEGQAYQPRGEWQLTLAYRRLESNQWFIGSTESSALAPEGQSPVFKIHTIVANVAYSFNDRLRTHVSLPISKGTFTRKWADKVEHQQSATGIGDVTVMGEAWLLQPRTHRRGNIQLGIGFKAPTGSHTAGSQFYTATSAVDYPADQTIQPGDGGWGIIAQSQAFKQLSDRTYGYVSGSYMASPKAHSDVKFTPTSPIYWSVPDVYSARLGGAFAVLPDQGVTTSLGARIDGIPIRDLFGGGDDITIKRTAYVIFAEPGLSYTRERGTFTLSVPYRLKVNRQKSLYEQATNGVNGGGFAKYLVFASYTHRL